MPYCSIHSELNHPSFMTGYEATMSTCVDGIKSLERGIKLQVRVWNVRGCPML